jgi:hypothetical protein
MNTRIRIVLGILILLCCSADRLHSQATVDYALYETVSNGSLAIYEICRAYNPGDYISVEAGCYIENPDGTQVWVDNGGYQTEESWAQTTYSPVSVFG